MPARNGRQYLDGLRAQERVLYLGGERVRDVTTHPGLANGARAVAALYDMQHAPGLCAEMTYTSPTSGDPVGAETDAGVIVRGARILATLAPFADEIAVYSPRVGLYAEGDSPYALSFAIPCGTTGLKFLCRDSLDQGRSHFDHPLTSRFEEMDCVVFFDDVLVPWERVFLLGDVKLLNDTASATHYSAHSAHQNAAKNLAKCELVLGLALLMTETLG